MAQVKVIVGSLSEIAEQTVALDVAAKLVEQAGGVGVAPIPTFETLDNGKARSEMDKAALEANGYKVAETVYERGRGVNATGVANARQSYRDWEKLPLTKAEACPDLIQRVGLEQRKDLQPLLTAGVRMDKGGRIIPSGGPAMEHDRFAATERGFKSLVNRLGCGGGEYLWSSCTPELRAINVNHQAVSLAEVERQARETVAIANAALPLNRRAELPKPGTVVFRTRRALDGKGRPLDGTGREVFATVSEGYAAFDADKIAGLVAAGVSPDCRGNIAYDGRRTRIEAILHSTVAPERYVAGEFFRAGIVVTSDDTGAGGIHVRGMIVQNLCLNLIILDESWQSFGRYVHRGTATLTDRVADAIARASSSLDHFRKVWGFASVEQAIPAEGLQMARELAMAGLFRGILQRELVQIPGRKEERVKQLVEAWKGDVSSATAEVATSKASVVNAFTRLAHEDGQLDPWAQDEISAAAGRLLLRKGSLPFEADAA